MKKTAGFTLIEILIAILILSVVASTIYAAFSGTFRIIKDSEYSSEVYAMARITMDRLIKDLEQIASSQGNPEFISRLPEFGSTEEAEISFRSKAHLTFGGRDMAEGIATIRYRLEKGKENKGYAIMRADILEGRNDQSHPNKNEFVLCDRIQSIDYKFYDARGNEYKVWNSQAGPGSQKNKAPTIVYIQLNIMNPDNEEQPYVFATKVFIPLDKRES